MKRSQNKMLMFSHLTHLTMIREKKNRKYTWIKRGQKKRKSAKEKKRQSNENT